MNGGYFFTTSNAGNNANSQVPLTSTGNVYGSGVSLSGGSVTLAAGTYVIDYSLQGDASGNGQTAQSEIVSAYLTLNGVEVPGSRLKSTTAREGGIENQVSNTLTITTTGGTLALFNGAAALTHGNLAGIVGSINVHQATP